MRIQFSDRKCPANHPVPEIAAIEMQEYGMLISVDCRDVNPNDVMTRLAKFWVPPLGIWQSSARDQISHVLGSCRHSTICSHFQPAFSVRPVPAMTTRSPAHCRSRGVKNLALEMESGSRNNNPNPNKKVATPRMMNIQRHGLMLWVMWPIPYARSDEMMPRQIATVNISSLSTDHYIFTRHFSYIFHSPPTEFPANQIPVLMGISSRVYQVHVMNIKAGETVASATPRKNLTVMRPP